ncbi:tetratricopeptide repeat protein [Nodularia sp. NIES-3585]|uniref:tetratricopeptide repeat protein n=1 Tax=Nodularia sp. NIES-3585 TaxID=1973477 RepID=UPI000B5C4E7B|nr:tetratricopeptide repeat protein [Nodularia sp. NIES-3585]GAX35331.1 tetratricopeptide TPR_2 [Nodularia sp. NIES-3585]
MSYLTKSNQLFQALEIDFEVVSLNQLDNYTAIEYFLTLEDEPPENANNLQKINRYLQVFHHLCEVAEWQKAGQVLSFCYSSKELHEQLRIWGYYRKQIELYQQLLGKLNDEQDIICLYGLGRAFYNLSDYNQSRIYYQKLLNLAKLINNRQAEAFALGGLGNIQYINYNFDGAIASFQKQLDIANEICDDEQKGYALRNLGYVFYFLGLNQGKYNYQQKGLHYLEDALEEAYQLDNQELESLSIDHITTIYFNRGQYNKSLTYLFRQLAICQKNNDKRRQAAILENIGKCYMMLKQCDQALKYSQEALIATQDIGDKWTEAKLLNDLGVIYCYQLKQYQEALFYFEQASTILHKLNIEGHQSVCAVNISVCYSYLKNQEKSVFYINMAKSLMTELESVETKGILIMSIANSYWLRDKIWYKAWGILLAIKALMIIPPWRSANGRLAMQSAIKQIFGR